jgi:hypothetical protein
VQDLSSGADHKCYIITKLDNDSSLTSTSYSLPITTNAASVVEAVDISMVYHYKFNSGDIVSYTIANYASGSAVYSGTFGNDISAGTISTSDYKVGSGAYIGLTYNPQTRIRLGTMTTSATYSGYTIATWFKYTSKVSDSYSGYSAIFAATISGVYKGIWIYLGGSGDGWSTSIAINDYYTNSSNYLSTNTWTHIAYTISAGSSSSTVKLYVNGSLLSSSTVSTVVALNSSLICTLNASNLGTNPNSFDSQDKSKITGACYDDFRFYRRELSATEIATIYAYT